MKKFLIIIPILIIIIIGIIFITDCDDTPRYTIELDSNPSTGYDWHYEITNQIVDIERFYDDSNCKEGILGCGGKTIYTLTPLKKGTTTIDFKYCRNYQEPCIKATYEINIDKNLNITETHKGSYFLEQD